MNDTREMEASAQVGRFLRKFVGKDADDNLVFAWQATQLGICTLHMLEQLWHNFRDYEKNGRREQISPVVVSDLLLSGLCRKIGPDLYEIDDAVRKQLKIILRRFAPELQACASEKGIARFTLQYIRRFFRSESLRGVYDALYWRALLLLDPALAADKISTLLERALSRAGEELSQIEVNLVVQAMQMEERHRDDSQSSRIAYFPVLSGEKVEGALFSHPIRHPFLLQRFQEYQNRKQDAYRKVYFTEKLSSLSFKMILIKGGRFIMGSSDNDEEAYADEKPAHEVQVPDFYLAEFPVTQELWEAVMGENPSHFKGATLPVREISWDDTQRFLEKLNALTGEKYRLPSEAEWEFAARGGRLSQGFKYAGSNDLEAVAWYDKNSNQKIHPVGELLPNELGLHDMSGNVYEWCQDHWHENYEGAPLDGSAWTTKTGGNRVPRGGGWLNPPRGCRVAYRNGAEPGSRYLIGFRLARSS